MQSNVTVTPDPKRVLTVALHACTGIIISDALTGRTHVDK